MARILIVDEAELFLTLERSFLRRTGFHLHAAATPAELLEKARKIRPDLVLLHSRWSRGPCGIPCARQLKADPSTAKIPVILICDADPEAGDAHRAPDRVLNSPVDAATLLEAVSALTAVTARTERRVAVSLPVRATGWAGSFRSRTKDLSAGGAFVRRLLTPPIGTPLRIEISLPAEEGAALVSAGAVVVRRVEEDPSSYLIPGMGLHLGEMEDASRRILEHFVERQGTLP